MINSYLPHLEPAHHRIFSLHCSTCYSHPAFPTAPTLSFADAPTFPTAQLSALLEGHDEKLKGRLNPKTRLKPAYTEMCRELPTPRRRRRRRAPPAAASTPVPPSPAPSDSSQSQNPPNTRGILLRLPSRADRNCAGNSYIATSPPPLTTPSAAAASPPPHAALPHAILMNASPLRSTHFSRFFSHAAIVCLIAVAGSITPSFSTVFAAAHLQPATAPEEGGMRRPSIPLVPSTTPSTPLTTPPAQPTNIPARPVPAATAPPTPSATSASMRRATADNLLRLALFNLRVVPNPSTTDFAASNLLLTLAQSFAPDDIELLRRRIESAWNAADKDLLASLTQRLVQLDPLNTVAQLRLISSRLAQFQTADERLSRIEQFLGPKGKSIDASIRSRLALDAALLYREKGNDAQFVAKLKQATQLDSTNKDAALLALNYYVSRSDDALGQLEMITNLLYADPVDPKVHYMLADHLARAGAFMQARRFHKISQNIHSAAGTPVDLNRTVESMCLDWRCEGVKAPFDYISGRLRAQRSIAAKTAREMLSEEGASLRNNLSNVPKPEDIRLDLQFEAVRAAASFIYNDQNELSQSIADFADTVAARSEVLAAPNARGPSWTDETAKVEIEFNRQDVILWRCITSTGLDKVPLELDGAIGKVEDTNPRKIAVLAWVALRNGDTDTALQLASPDLDEPYVRLCRAEALSITKQTVEATALFDDIAATNPMTVISTFALERAAAERGVVRLPGDSKNSPTAAPLHAYAESIPTWIDTMISQPRLIQSLTLGSMSQRIGPLDRMEVTLKMKNVSPIPLAVGSDKPINSRFLFNPLLELASSSRTPQSEPEVYEFDSRLRLLPGEEMVCTVSPDIGVVGYIAQINSAGPTRVRYRILQGFEARGNSRDKGPGSLEANTPTVAREALLESRLTAEQLTTRLQNATDSVLPAILTGVRAYLLSDVRDPAGSGPREDLQKALGALYPSWSPTARTLCAAMMPPAGQNDAFKPLDIAIKADPDASIKLIAILTRVAAIDEPLLAAAESSGDPSLVAAAAFQRERLAASLPTYAKIGLTNLVKDTTTRGPLDLR